MVGYTDTSAQAALDSIITTYPFLALFSAVGSDAGTGFTEAAFTNYARVNTAGLWAASIGSGPSTKSNNANIAFANSGSAGADIIGFGFYTLAGGGVLGYWDYMGNFPWKPASFSLASPSVVTLAGHGFANGDRVVVTAGFGSAGTIAAGWTAALLTVAGVTTDTFTAGVNAANTGDFMVRKVQPQSVVQNMQITSTAGQLTLALN